MQLDQSIVPLYEKTALLRQKQTSEFINNFSGILISFYWEKKKTSITVACFDRQENSIQECGNRSNKSQ